MLNELYDLSASIQAAGIATSSWHRNLKKCPKSATYKLLITGSGSIGSVERLDADQIANLRKYEVSNGCSFPAFNVPPLLWAGSDKAKQELASLRSRLSDGTIADIECARRLLDSVWSSCDELWFDGDLKRIDSCLKGAGLCAALRAPLQSAPSDSRALAELLARAHSLTALSLRDGMKAALATVLSKPSDGAGDLVGTLLASTAPDREKAKNVSVVLELADASSFTYPANHSKVQAWVNDVLLSSVRGSDSKNDTDAEQDAYGERLSGHGTKLPDVQLPILGKVILRAMNKEAPCQKRYGRIDAQSFPVGSAVRQRTKDALEWLGDVVRRNRTWADVSGACGFTRRDGKTVPKAAVLFAYPSYLSDTTDGPVGLFVEDTDNRDSSGALFEAVSARVIPALQGMVRQSPEAEVRVFVLVRADKARTKVFCSRRCDAAMLIEATKSWQAGATNIPAIALPAESVEAHQSASGLVPFPSEVVKCLNVRWMEGGSKTSGVNGLHMGEGIDLLIDKGPALSGIAARVISLAVGNSGQLFLALGHASHLRDGTLKLDKRYAKYARLLPSVLGLSLYKLGFRKGEYMSNAPFLVGQMLALADTLHKEYCRHVRDGNVPPQLIGNGLMPAAIDSPERGLARLRERLLVYQSWANTAQGEGVGLAKWTLGELRKVSSDLASQTIPTRTSDADKAQMFLGYLAGRDKQES